MSMDKAAAKDFINSELELIKAKFAKIAELGVEHQIDVLWDGLDGYGDRAWLITKDEDEDGYSWREPRAAGTWQASSNSC